MRTPALAGGPRLVCPFAQSGRLARVLSYAELVYFPVHDLDDQAYEYYCRVGWSQEFRVKLCSLGFGSEKK